MARINTNVASLIAQSNLSRSHNDLAVRLQRLSTGLRINRGADDPAGLIVSERLRSEVQGLDQAIHNSERASLVISTTEAYLAEVADLLNSIKSLVVEAANTGALSAEEIEANQLQIDSAIESITRISNTASFAGMQLLNGSMDYITSGVNGAQLTRAKVFSAQFGNNATVPVGVQVVASARTGSLFLSGINGAQTGALASTVTIEVAGNLGVQTLTFASGTTYASIIAAVNTYKESTGVSASFFNVTSGGNSGMRFNSTAYGSDQFVSVRKIGSGGELFTLYPAKGTAEAVTRGEGRDVTAVVNGALARGKGLDVSINSPGLSAEFTLATAFNTTVGGLTSTFHITGGGSTFQLGPTINANQQVGFGVQSVAASQLGGTSIEGVRYFLDSLKAGGENAIVKGQSANATKVLESAINDISIIRGRLGAFERNTIQPNIRALQIGLENITSSESRIRDADFAKETAALTRAQILTQAGTSVLATANVNAQNVLALLG